MAKKLCTEKEHSGVCIYTKDSYVAKVIHDIPNENGCEILWIKISPRRLPRGFSCANKTIKLDYLQSSLELLETKYRNCGLILAGDFNKLPIRHISRQFQLKQIVNFNTRGSCKLDLILTNLSDSYEQPLSIPALGLTDHLTVLSPYPKKEPTVAILSKQFMCVTRDPAAFIVLEDFYVKFHGI